MPLSAQDIQTITDGANTKCDEIGVARGTVANRPNATLPAGFVFVQFGRVTRFEIGHVDDSTGLERTADEIRALARATIHGQFRPGEVITPIAPPRKKVP